MFYGEKTRVRGVAEMLYSMLITESFDGKGSGSFIISRDQLKQALRVPFLDNETVVELKHTAFREGVVLIDFDEHFACVEKGALKKYRRPSVDIFSKLVHKYVSDPAFEAQKRKELWIRKSILG